MERNFWRKRKNNQWYDRNEIDEVFVSLSIAQTSLSPQILGSQHTTTRPSIVGPQSMKGGDKKTKFIPQKSNIGPQFKEAKIDKDNNGNKNTNKQTEINTNKTKNINEKVPMNKKRKHQ